jgi:hypothetical protein
MARSVARRADAAGLPDWIKPQLTALVDAAPEGDHVLLAQNSPIRVSLPRFHYRVGLHIDLFEVCSAFTHVAACTLALSPNS